MLGVMHKGSSSTSARRFFTSRSVVQRFDNGSLACSVVPHDNGERLLKLNRLRVFGRKGADPSDSTGAREVRKEKKKREREEQASGRKGSVVLELFNCRHGETESSAALGARLKN